MLKLYFENFKNNELSFTIENEQGDRIDRIWFKGEIIVPQNFDAAVVAYLPKLLKTREDLKIMGPVSSGLLKGARQWVQAFSGRDVFISADLKIGSTNFNDTWLVSTNIKKLNIKSSPIEDYNIACIATGLLFSNKYKGILLENADIAYELLNTNSFNIIANGGLK